MPYFITFCYKLFLHSTRFRAYLTLIPILSGVSQTRLHFLSYLCAGVKDASGPISPPRSWELICAHAIKTHKTHVLKLVFACWALSHSLAERVSQATQGDDKFDNLARTAAEFVISLGIA